MISIGTFLQAAVGSGIEGYKLNLAQVLLRGTIVFFVTLAIIRTAGRRFLAGRNPLDVMLGFILASMMARAVNGSAAFFQTLIVGFFLAVLYRSVAYVAFKSHRIGIWLKGTPELIVHNGDLDQNVMRRNRVSKEDVLEDMRLIAAVDHVGKVKSAHIERNGEISVQRKPQIFDISVKHGVQTVRVEVEV